MISLTDPAREAIRRLLDGSSQGATGLRILVDQGGCSGLKYLLGLERAAADDDRVVTVGDVLLFVDPLSVPMLEGMNIDFVESVEGSGFVFENPKAASMCSCGKSFSL